MIGNGIGNASHHGWPRRAAALTRIKSNPVAALRQSSFRDRTPEMSLPYRHPLAMAGRYR
jgi:hypothetical protein